MDDEATTTTLGADQLLIVMTVYGVLLICSASLSVIGSSTIVFKILRDRGALTPYDRIIFGLSCGDILSSIFWAISPFLKIWNPSPASCRAWGVLCLLALWSIWYNGLLSFYFLVTVLSQVRRKDFVRKCELWMHLSGIFVPILAIIGYSSGWFDVNDLGTGCEIPSNFNYIVYIPIAASFLFMIINYGAIYAVVQKSLRSSNESSGNVACITPVQRRLKKEATTMMMLYVGCFFVTLLPNVVYGLFFLGKAASILSIFVQVLMGILSPLQGFFNVFIYLKPAYTRFRAANRDKPMHFVLHQALFNPKVPQLEYSSDPTVSNAIAEEDVGISGINFESSLHFHQGAEEDENSSDSSA